MDKNNVFSKVILDSLYSLSSCDKIVVCSIEDNKLKDCNSNLSIDIDFKERSLIAMAIKSHFPVVINNLDSSPMYNKDIDNMLNIDISHIMILPLACDYDTFVKYIVILYKVNYQNIFKIEEKADIKDFISNHIEKHKDVLCKDIACRDSCIPIKNKIKKQQEFFSSTIHDIRTPINSVMGFLELLQLEENDKGKKEYLDLAFKSSQTITTLINDVLDISKIEAGKLDINIQLVSIIEEFESLSLLFSYMTKKKNINFMVYYDPIIPYIIRTDIDRIKQIIGNLLSNAIKFTPINGIIELKIKYIDSTDNLEISIKDNGIGISSEAQKNIFTPFQQASKDTSSKYGGTGLGLSISRNLVELLGGELKLESKEGEGSRFYFNIPCNTIPFTPETIDRERFNNLSINIFTPKNYMEEMKFNFIKKYFERLNIKYNLLDLSSLTVLKEELNHDEIFILLDFKDKISDYNINYIQKRLILITEVNLNRKFIDKKNISIINPPIKISTLFDNLENNILLQEKIEHIKEINRVCNILIIDDSIINLKLMGEIIKKIGHKPYLLDKPTETIDTIRDNKIDIIFIDQHMPDIDGDKLIKKIRLSKIGKDVVIHGLTGSSEKKVTDKMIEAGASSILTKPISIDSIVNIIDKDISN